MQKLKEEFIEISNKSHLQLIEKFYQYLEIDDENLYRKKMIGFILLLGIHDKNPYRFPFKEKFQRMKNLNILIKIIYMNH